MHYIVLFLLLLVPAKSLGDHVYSNTVETIGDIGQFLIPATGFALTLSHNDWVGVKQFVYGGAASQLTSAAIKYSLNLERPNHHDCSFPSGHTTMAFYGAGFMTRRYGRKFAIPAFAAAIFVGYSRVHTKQHWPTDVLMGAAIGIFYNFVFTTRYHEKCCIYPAVTRDSFALCLDYKL